jgi:hypothetical protein
VFMTAAAETGTWRCLRSFRTAFETACGHAKLTGVTPRTLRHAWASRLDEFADTDKDADGARRLEGPEDGRRDMDRGDFGEFPISYHTMRRTGCSCVRR